jgi:uncharacterized protein (TIGR00303 family)
MVEAISTFIRAVNDPRNRLTRVLEHLGFAVKKPGRMALAIGSTETSDIDGISAAGHTAEARRITPALDAEALVLGLPVTHSSIPASPEGIVSPVVASRAMVNLLDCKIEIFDCGAFVSPKLEALRVGGIAARRLDTGEALELKLVERLFEQGREQGQALGRTASYIVIGECVPAGTTTALGVLTALGYDASKLVSSSMLTAMHDVRHQLVASGIKKSGLGTDDFKQSPLKAVAAVGDPMQPFVAGLALEAAKRVPVILGGGTQMLAVYALARAIMGDAELLERSLAVITTKWVVNDKHSNPTQLSVLVDAPFAASFPNFTGSRHRGLQAYEEGNVKEGVAAGAMMAIAHLAGFSSDRIQEAIDFHYDRMVHGM